MNIFQSNVYNADLNWQHLDDEQGEAINNNYSYPFLHHIQQAIGSTISDMKPVFHTNSERRFIQIKR